ncbi:MAG: DUF2961 domain-containing protein [Deltaproteobacteria bacterium]|nr:DUF2961 domain-containing protein [Deltaproteobacteria bacterium]
MTSRDLDPARRRKALVIEAGQTQTLCRLTGAGSITRFWMTLPLTGQGPVLKDAVLRVYWDGESDPSIETPLGDFFGASFGRPRRLVSAHLVITGGAYLCRFEMPFNTGARIEVENQGSRPLRHLFFQVGYLEEPARTTPVPTLHAQYRREDPTTSGRSFAVLEARGEGWLAGLKMDLQCREWWLRPPLADLFLPRGFGLGILEGWETMVVDGDGANALCGTGTEDYFSGGFYFLGRPFCTPTHGCTHLGLLTGRVSAYRLHLDDPIHFEQSLDIGLDHGLENSMAGDFTSVAYWYQQEPHHPFPALPPAAERRPGMPWKNIAQWALLGGSIIAPMAGLVAVVVWLAGGVG